MMHCEGQVENRYTHTAFEDSDEQLTDPGKVKRVLRDRR